MRPERDAPVEDWLDWLGTLHPAEIELGLERTARVADRLGLREPGVPIITVAGTNGKGSVCAFLEAILTAAGWCVGLYTSPHLERYHERVRVAGQEIDDTALRSSFAAVDAGRGDARLTFFEFGTLAAIQHFRAAGVDIMVLETGLGGRLDATNVFDADVAVVTSIGIDHADWLGSDRNGIAREKAGIARAGRPLVLAEPDPPAAWPEIVASTGAREIRRDRDYAAHIDAQTGSWSWSMADDRLDALPMPAWTGGYQVDNAAAAITALALSDGRPPERAHVEAGLASARIPGRFEIIEGPVEVILDVGHNPQAAATLARNLATRPLSGNCYCVIGVYQDKDVAGIVAALAGVVDAWFCLPLPPPRGCDARSLAECVGRQARAGAEVFTAADADATALYVRNRARPGDRVVVTGSFATVARMRRHFL